MNKKKLAKSTKGITLIALVITIIVLLILAGVTIAAISGNEGVLDKAQSAKNKTDIANAKEAAMLKTTDYVQEFYQKKYVTNDSSVAGISNAGAYIAGKYATAVQTGSYYIQKDSTTGKIKVSTDAAGSNVIVEGTLGDNGTITWSDEVASGGGGGPVEDITKVSETEKEITYSVTSFDKIVSSSSNTVTILPSQKNTKIVKGTGATQQQIIVPAGFKVVAGTKLEDGMVIKDASETDGNEFVWVPVNQTLTFADSTTGQIELARYIFTSGNTPNYAKAVTETTDNGATPINVYFTETTSNSVAINIEDFKARTNAAKGYYIGRYEAGIENGIYDSTDKVWNKTDSTKDMVTVCKANKTVYNNIIRGSNTAGSLTGAVKEARGMYDDKDGFISDLVNSYAWDTAIVFIEKCGTKTNSSTYAFQNALTSSGPLNTGAAQDSSNNKDVQCNIYDMAGNVVEWTTEYSSYTIDGTSYLCVDRGGYYRFSSSSTANRYHPSTTYSYGYIGFRPLLYIK